MIENMTIALQHKRLYLVIVFQIYCLYINIDSLSQYIWTWEVPNYIHLTESYIIKYYIILL